jgi:predicted permease
MLAVFVSVLPIFLLIVLGHLTKKYFVTDQGFWAGSDKLVYYLFFPALLVREIGAANFGGSHVWGGLLATMGSTLGVAALIFAGRWLVPIKADLFTSIFQGGIRYNTFVFIALAQSLFGAAGLSLASVFIAYMIILINVLCVLVLTRYGAGNEASLIGLARGLLRNPLIIAALLGVLINRTGYHIPDALKPLLQYLGNAATPLSLMSTGAGLLLVLPTHKLIATGYAVGLKLLLLPGLTFALLRWQGVSGLVAQVALLFAAMPCAGNAYVLARQLGGDTEAMASIITWSTLLSILSITVMFAMLPG